MIYRIPKKDLQYFKNTPSKARYIVTIEKNDILFEKVIYTDNIKNYIRYKNIVYLKNNKMIVDYIKI